MSIKREEAFSILKKYTNSKNLIKHALTVETIMQYFADKYNEDKEKWGVIGLVHDLDYDLYPDEHCKKTEEILKKENWPMDYIRAISSHGWGICTDVEPVHKMEKVLYAIDELSGLITAAVLVRPSKSIMDLKLKSVKKKWKDKSFAAGANREIIQKGADMLDVSIEDLIEDCIKAMQGKAELLELKGEL